MGGGSAMPLALGGGRAARLVAPGARRRPLSDTREIPPCEPADPGAISPAPPHWPAAAPIRPAAAPACGRAHGPPRPIPSGPLCPGRPAPIAAPPRPCCWKAQARYAPTAGPRRAAAFLKRHRVTSSSSSFSARCNHARAGHVLVVLAQLMQSCSRRSSRQPARRDAPDKRARRRGCGGSAPADSHQRGVAQLADVHHHVPVVAGQPRRTVGQRQAGRDARAALAELRDQAGDVALPETQRRHHAQMAGHHAPAARQLVGQVIDFIADLGGALRQQATFVGQGRCHGRNGSPGARPAAFPAR